MSEQIQIANCYEEKGQEQQEKDQKEKKKNQAAVHNHSSLLFIHRNQCQYIDVSYSSCY